MLKFLKSARCKRNLVTQIRNLNELPKDSFAVIVGGGVLGTSVAYHLTQRGVRDIVILERGKFGSGTAFYTGGLVSSAHPVHRYKPFLAWSVELYSRIGDETGVNVGFSRPGTLRLATTEARLDEFRRYTARDYFQEGDVAKTTLVDANEVRRLAPLIDSSKVVGGLYTSGDGFVDPGALTKALVKGAENGGAVAFENCPEITSMSESKNSWVIKFSDGSEIRTQNVINAAGLWAKEFARMTNLEVHMVIAEHQFARIGPVSNIDVLKNMPAIVDHESSFYMRPDGDGVLLGGFEQNASDVAIREDWTEHVPKELTLESHFERIEPSYKRACELIPSLVGASVQPRATAFTMLPDGYPLVGPINDKQNYWLQTGHFGTLSSGGGMGKYLADWIIDGEPPSELFDTDANRFARWTTHKYMIEKCRETYSKFYDWSHTNRTAARPTERVSGIYARLLNEGCFNLFRNGWEVAESFAVKHEHKLSNMIYEYQTVIDSCGVIDLSWRGKIEVKGKDSEQFLDYVLASRVPPICEVSTGLMLTRKGNIMAHMELFHHDQFRTEFILLSDPERESRDVNWLKRAASELQANVEISAVSEYLASLALVGPKSREILEELTKSDLNFENKAAKSMKLGNVPVIAVRSTATTGQLSYEVFHSRGDTLMLYNSLMREGKKYGIVNFGQSTLNIMRIENGHKIWGREITLNTNPYECGISHIVDMNKSDFIGKVACAKLSKENYARKLVLVACEPLKETEGWLDVPRRMEVIRKEGCEDRVGQITSGTYSVHLQRPLAFAWVHSGITASDALSIDVGGKRLSAKIYEGDSVYHVEKAVA